MISLNDKITNNNYSKYKKVTGLYNTPVTQNEMDFDSVSFSGASPNSNKTKNKKNNITGYIIGGLAIAAGIIFAVIKFKKGETPSTEAVKNIEKDAKDLTQKASHNAGSTGGGGSSYTSSSSNNYVPPKSSNNINNSNAKKETLNGLEKEKKDLEAELNQLKKDSKLKATEKKETNTLKEEFEQLSQQEKEFDAKVQEQLNQRIDDFIKLAKPDNDKIAREVFPTLELYAEKLTISPTYHLDYCNQITQKNKDFAINEGIPLIANNMEKIKTAMKDPENSHKLLSELNSDNKDIFLLSLSKLNKAKCSKVNDATSLLKLMTPENKKFALVIIENPEKYKINEIDDITSYINEIKSENRNFALNEIMPLVIKNNDKLKIETGSTMAKVLGHITPKTKDVIKLVSDNAEKLNLNDLELGEFIKAITPQNKDCISLVAQNAEKLELFACFDSSDYAAILNKGKNGILEELNKS